MPIAVVLSADVLENAAKAAYEKMISLTFGAEEAKEHSWERQGVACRECWRRAVEAAFAEAFPSAPVGPPSNADSGSCS